MAYATPRAFLLRVSNVTHIKLYLRKKIGTGHKNVGISSLYENLTYIHVRVYLFTGVSACLFCSEMDRSAMALNRG